MSTSTINNSGLKFGNVTHAPYKKTQAICLDQIDSIEGSLSSNPA
jgi:hypothetical protein